VSSGFETNELLYPITKGDVGGHAFHGNQYTQGMAYGGRGHLTVGTRVRVSEGSGIDSNKTGVVVHPREVKTDGRLIPTNVEGAYKPVDWSRETAVKLDNGNLITMFNNRLSEEKPATDTADKIMDAVNKYADEHPDAQMNRGWQTVMEQAKMIGENNMAIPKSLVNSATADDIAKLTDNNYHSAVEAILRQRPDLQK
jgi:hypothetical protein